MACSAGAALRSRLSSKAAAAERGSPATASKLRCTRAAGNAGRLVASAALLLCCAPGCMSLLREAPTAEGGVTEEFLRLRPQETGLVAVLPPTNETPDMDLPPIVRSTLVDGLAAKGFRVIDAKTVDERLVERGVSQAGQLATMGVRSVGEAVGAEYLLYSNIEEFGRVVLWTRKGYCRRLFSSYRLVHAPTERMLWLASSDATEPLLLSTTGGLVRRGVRSALGTLSGDNVLSERQLEQPLHRERLTRVVWQMYGGWRPADSGFYAGTLVRIGSGPTHFEAGLTYGASGRRTAMAGDFGACRWFPYNTFLASYLSAGLSIGGRTVDGESGFLFVPYATAGVGFHVLGALSTVDLRLSEAAGGLGIGMTMGYIF